MERMSQKTFTGNGSLTVQAGVYFIEIEGIGAGGGGGGGRTGTVNTNESPLGGGGGGAGIMSKITISVTPGTTYDVIIGTAGTAGAGGAPPGSPTNGGAGGDTTFQTGGGTILARFVGGSGGKSSPTVLDAAGYTTNGGMPANNPYVSSASTSATSDTIFALSSQPRIIIGEGGTGGDSNTSNKTQGLAGSNALVYNATGYAGGVLGTPGTDAAGPYYGGGAGGGGAASYYGSGGAGGNGGNGSVAGSGAAGTAGSAVVGALGSGGGGGGAGGCGPIGAGTGANGAAGKIGQIIIYWYE